MGDENETLPEKVSVSDSVIGSGSDNGSSCGSDNYNYNGNESFACVITFIISSLFHPSISSLHFFFLVLSFYGRKATQRTLQQRTQ